MTSLSFFLQMSHPASVVQPQGQQGWGLTHTPPHGSAAFCCGGDGRCPTCSFLGLKAFCANSQRGTAKPRACAAVHGSTGGFCLFSLMFCPSLAVPNQTKPKGSSSVGAAGSQCIEQHPGGEEGLLQAPSWLRSPTVAMLQTMAVSCPPVPLFGRILWLAMGFYGL